MSRVSKPAFPRNTTAFAIALALAAGGASAGPDDLVRINATEVFRIGDDTVVLLDDQPITPQEALRLARGHRAFVEASMPADASGIPSADLVRIETLLRGPLTALDAPAVLGQPLVVTGDTVFDGLAGLEALSVGDRVEVSGVPDLAGGAVFATRIARLDPARDWKLTGVIDSVAGETVRIGAQAVDVAGMVPTGCGGPPAVGQFVEIEAIPDPGFLPGATLQGVTALGCEDAAFDGTEPPEGNASIEGIISALPDPLPDPPAFELAGIGVVTTPQTEYRGGTLDDLDLGARIEAHGQYDPSSGVLSASEIRFLQAQVRVIAPADAGAFNGDGSVDLMGLHFAATPQVRDEDALLPLGPPSEVQLELRAFVDADGALFLTRLRERGAPDAADLRLQGPVSAIADPRFEVLGRSVDASMAVFQDASGQTLTREAFFAQLVPGMIVSAEEAGMDGITGVLSPALVHLEDGVVQPQLDAGGKALAQASFSTGTISALGDPASVFRDDFE